MAGGLCDRGRACVVVGMHGKGGMHGGGCASHAGPPGRYYVYSTWSMSGWYASYWNAFLYLFEFTGSGDTKHCSCTPFHPTCKTFTTFNLTCDIERISYKQVCIPVGCVLPTCCLYLPACTVQGGCLLPGGVSQHALRETPPL